MTDVEEFYAPDRAAWRQWLSKNHDRKKAVWLVYDKGEQRTMKWEDIVQEALCFGWIDSIPRKRDDGRSMIYVSRRKPKSVWSKINKAHIEVLLANGQMMPAGQAAIDVAKANGSWDTLTQSDNMVVPDVLQVALTADPAAQENFAKLTDSQRRQILQWVYDAKREETRAARVAAVVRSAREGRHANNYRRPQV